MEDEDEEEDEDDVDSDNDRDGDEEESDTFVTSDEEGEVEPAPVAITSILDNVDEQLSAAELGIILPPHHRCGSHTFNLVATTDAEKAGIESEKDTAVIKKGKAAYQKQKDATIKRCKAVWNKQNRSSGASDEIKRLFGRLFPSPCVTRWNSEEESLRYVYSILVDEEKRALLNDFCGHWKLSPFRKSDAIFIKEYLKVRKVLRIFYYIFYIK